MMSESRTSSATEVGSGSVVLLSDFEGDELLPAVIRRVTDEALTVVPVSGDVHFATEWDLLLDRNLLGYVAMARVWNFGTVLREQVAEVAAMLSESQQRALDALALAARGSGQVPAGIPVGPPTIEEADPRLLHQEVEAELVRRFWEPALALAGAETLGQLVHHRREELRLAAAELEDVTAARGWLGDLEADTLGLRRVVPAAALGALLRQLRLGASQRLARIATWTLEAQAPSFARRGAEPGAEDVLSVSDYVAAVLDELEGR